MVNYNIDAASSGFDQFKRRSTNREVDPVSRSRINKSPLDDKTSSGFDQFNRRKTNQGLGSPTNQTNMKDDDDDKDVGGIGRLFAKFFGAAEENGLEFTTPDKKPKPSIYDRDDMKSFSYDPRTRTSSITGYPSDSDMRSSDEIMGSIDEMLSGENDPEYSYFSGSTYDEVRGPERNIVDAVNMAIDKTSATGDYKVRKGDTLSEIAEAAGTTVRQLQLINNIPDPKKMQAGSKLRVPATTSQDKEIIESATKMSDLRPLRFANQSMMTGDQRTYGLEGDPVVIPEYQGTPSENIQQTGAGTYESVDYMTELEILARTIEAEAGGESKEGKIAVGAVIANRADSTKYGMDIKGVILKKAQFSPWNAITGYEKGISQAKPMLTEKMSPSEDSYEAARKILSGNYVDETDGATHYLNPKVGKKPSWYKAFKGRERGTKKIGRHEFGNADSNKKYDGKDYINTRVLESPRPQQRPPGMMARRGLM